MSKAYSIASNTVRVNRGQRESRSAMRLHCSRFDVPRAIDESTVSRILLLKADMCEEGVKRVRKGTIDNRVKNWKKKAPPPPPFETHFSNPIHINREILCQNRETETTTERQARERRDREKRNDDDDVAG